MSKFFGSVNEVYSYNNSRESDLVAGEVIGDAMWLSTVVYYCCYGNKDN